MMSYSHSNKNRTQRKKTNFYSEKGYNFQLNNSMVLSSFDFVMILHLKFKNEDGYKVGGVKTWRQWGSLGNSNQRIC